MILGPSQIRTVANDHQACEEAQIGRLKSFVLYLPNNLQLTPGRITIPTAAFG